MTARRCVAGLDGDQDVVAQNCGHLPVALAQRPSEAAQEIERNAELDVVHGCEDPFEVGGLVLERRLLELEVPLLHCGAEDDVTADACEGRLRARLQRWHLDGEVVVRERAAGEPPPGVQLLDREGARIDRSDRRVPRDDANLALLARAVTAARRVDRDAVPARRIEDRRSCEHARFPERLVLRTLQEAEPDPVGVRLGKLDGRLGAHVAAAACFARKSAIQRAPHSSWPSRKSPARTASTH